MSYKIYLSVVSGAESIFVVFARPRRHAPSSEDACRPFAYAPIVTPLDRLATQRQQLPAVYGIPSQLTISTILWELTSACGSPFPPQMYAVCWQLTSARDSPSPLPIFANLWQLTATPSHPSFSPFSGISENEIMREGGLLLLPLKLPGIGATSIAATLFCKKQQLFFIKKIKSLGSVALATYHCNSRTV